jgi:hypothetical protein
MYVAHFQELFLIIKVTKQDFYGEAGFFSMFAVCKVRLKEIYELFLLCGMTN